MCFLIMNIMMSSFNYVEKEMPVLWLTKGSGPFNFITKHPLTSFIWACVALFEHHLASCSLVFANEDGFKLDVYVLVLLMNHLQRVDVEGAFLKQVNTIYYFLHKYPILTHI